MPFDASPSWSGFNYQGKVALYHALRIIRSPPPGIDSSNCELMLENNEDFEILHNGKPVSFHQVKAYNSSSYSEYSNALIELCLSLFNNPTVNGLIHTWLPINSKPGSSSLEESLKISINELLIEYDDSNPKAGETRIEKASSGQPNVPKISAILRAAFPIAAADEIYRNLNAIISGTSCALSRLRQYEYEPGIHSCSLDDINSKIELEISNILAAQSVFISGLKLSRARHCFLGMIDNYITQRHNTYSAEKTSISFDEILRITKSDHEDISDGYLAYQIKEIFANKFDDYMIDPESYTPPEDGHICNLQAIKKMVFGMPDMDLWSCYRYFSPHVNLQGRCNVENIANINKEAIRYFLLKIFHAIDVHRLKGNSDTSDFVYATTDFPTRYYLPTTITNSATPSQILREIISNQSFCEALYEIDHFIYGGSASQSFPMQSVQITEAPQTEGENVRSRRFDFLSKITLTSITDAKDALSR